MTAARDPVIGARIVEAYVGAFQLGYRILTGVAIFQLILCLGLGRVVLDANTNDKAVVNSNTNQQRIDVPEEKQKDAIEELDNACVIQEVGRGPEKV